MKRSFFVFVILIAIFFTSCEQFEQGGLKFEYSWSDAEGKAIEPPALDDLYAWAELTYKGEQKTTGPVAMADEEASLRFDNLPYDTKMVMKMTIRISEIKDKAPEARTDNVVYFCTSEEFELKRGKVTVVKNGCKMEPGPALSEDNKPSSPELKIVYSKGSNKIEVSSETEMKTPSNKVEVLFKAPNDLFNTVILANDTGFVIGKKEFPRPAKDEEGYYRISGYDLNEGLPVANDGSRIVAIKLRNSEGFESLQSSVTVFLDTAAPVLNLKNDASAYNGSATVVVTVSSNETLKENPVTGLYDSDLKLIKDLTQEAEELQKGTSYRYQIPVIDNLTDGNYTIKVKGMDIVDNSSDELETEEFTVDSLPPELDGTPAITPERAAQDTEYTVTFKTKDDMSKGKVAVTRKEETLTCTNEGGDYTCKGTTPEGTGDSIDPVVISLTDEAGNPASFNAGSIYVDRTAPVLNTQIVPGNKSLNASQILQITVNASEELASAPTVTLTKNGGGAVTPDNTEIQGLSYIYTYPTLSDGTYSFTANATDLAGHNAPQVSITSIISDSSVPNVTGVVTVTPTRIKPSATSTITFTASEPMNDTGDTVEVKVGNGTANCTTSNGLNYSCTYTGTGTGSDSIETISITLTDSSANTTTSQHGTIYVDRTLPVLTAQIVPGDKTLNAAELLQITINASEELSGSPAVQLLDSGSTVINPTKTEKQGLSYIYTYPVLDDDAYSFTADAADLAGHNAAQVSITSIISDSSIPNVTGVVTVTPTRIKPSATSTITFTASETMNDTGDTVEVKVGSANATCNTANGLNYSCTYTGSGTGSDSIETISITLTDSSANTTTTQHGTLYVDRTAPSMISNLLTPENAKENTKISVSVIFDEPVKDLSISDDGLGLVCSTGGDPLRYSCEYFVKSTDTEKGYAVEISANDIAGNPLADGVLGTVYVDMTEPQIEVSTCSVTTRRAITKNGMAAATTGDVVEITLGMNIEPGIETTMTLGNKLLTQDCETPADNCFAYSVSGSDSEGYKMVGIEAVDNAGNYYSETVNIENCSSVFDFTGPVLATAVISRIPDYVPARDHNTKTLSFSLTDPFTDEAVVAQLNLFADEELNSETIEITGFDFGEPLEVIDNYASFERMLDNGITEGTKNLSVLWQDILGNSATRAVNWKMFIDKTEPNPSVIDMKKVLYTRKPWGTEDTGGVPKFSVAGETGSVTDSNISTIVAYNELGSIIGNTTVSGGSFSIPNLNGGDLPKIYLNPIKKSGVKSTGTGALVTEIKWHATMGGKTPKDIYTNPHTFFTNSIFNNKLNQEVDSTDEPKFAGHSYLKTIGRTTWTNMKAGSPKPSKRALFATAYDSIRGKLVLFGGSADSGEDETWEWDGISWTKLDPVHKPTPREAPAMAFDSSRGRTVLFGGMGADNETWEWDGSDWTMMDSIDKPSVRFGHAMTYDSIRGKTVLFGGAYDGPCSDETWEWDGINWKLIETTVKPLSRAFQGMVFDSSSGKTIMFGGGSQDGIYDDTWEYDGSNWTQIVNGTTPPARYSHSLSYDSKRKKIIMFGGDPDTGEYLNDIWEWNGEDWNKLNTLNNPPERMGHSMNYINTYDRFIMIYGEGDSGYTHDMWEFNRENITWSDITPSEINPSERRAGHSMVYDINKGVSLLFGGERGSLVYNDTWAWNGINWNKLTEGTPPLRYGHSMAYNTVSGSTILFGGYDYFEHPSGYFYDDTWEWNGTSWTQKNPVSKPSTRYYHSMTYDVLRNIVVLFGGTGNSMSNQETWEWNGTDWVQRTGNTCTGTNCYICSESTCPSHYSDAAMVYDKERKKTVLFGGRNYDGSNDETWEWDGVIWNKLNPENKPSARSSHAMTYDASRERVMLFGGQRPGSGHQYSDELWEWNGINWSLQNPVKRPLPRKGHAMSYDLTRNKVVLLGGSPGSDETWEWDAGFNDKPVQIVNIAFDSSGITDLNIQSLSVLFNAGGYGEFSNSTKTGVDLLVWRDNHWAKVSYNDADTDSISPVVWETDNIFEILAMLNGGIRKFNFAVTPSGTNGYLVNMSSVATDYVEVAVRYWLPPAISSNCGNSIIDDGEECDDGNNIFTDTCTYCRNAVCGDGYTHSGVEECDDRNSVENDYCRNDCTRNVCGDAIIYTGVEQCEDGNTVTTDACVFCKDARCGDGFVWEGNEECDDANDDNTDACVECADAFCGDGFIREGFEDCDDGNTNDGDGCDSNCTPTGCGNGVITSSEECDDSNSDNSDNCVGCKNAFCGDGFVKAVGEQCDDANENESDGCLNNCTVVANWTCTGNPSVCGYCTPTVSLATWASGDDGWSYAANWARQTTAGQGGANGWMRFYWDPAISTSYTRALTSSTSVNIAGCTNPTISFYSLLDNFNASGNEYLRLDCSGNGGSTWTDNIWTWRNNTADHNWTQRTATVPTNCRSNNAVFRFRATGVDTNNINWWGVDTVTVN